MRKIKIAAMIIAFATLFGAILAVNAFAKDQAVLASESWQIDTKALLSRGLLHIYKNKAMVKSGKFGDDIYFEKRDFQRVLNLSDDQLDTVTVTRAPANTDGELRIGASKITDGQKISAENIAYLTFVPASDDVSVASFSFLVNDMACAVECNLYFTDKENSSPTVSKAVSAYNSVMVYSSYEHEGSLCSYDADGDEVKYVIVKYPKNGSVIMSDASGGKYEYVHKKGFVGNDSFSYCAVDKYGNWSESISVNIEVRAKGKDAPSFADLEKHKNPSAVLCVTSADVMSGTVVGNTNYFYPEKAVSRAEFVVMAMHALGIKADTSGNTEFADDSEIVSYMKPYVKSAYEKGYVTGKFVDGKLYFEPDAPISKGEAVAILGAMAEFGTDISDMAFNFTEDVPAWAKDSFYELAALGIIDVDNGNFSPDSALTKMDCAEILSKIMIIKNTD